MMKCRKCGAELEKDALFCDNCGCKVETIDESSNEAVDNKAAKKLSELKQDAEIKDNEEKSDIWHTIGNIISGMVGLYALYIVFKIFIGSYDSNPVPALITLAVVGIFWWIEGKLPNVHPLVFSVVEIVCLVFALNTGSNIQAVEIVKMSAPEMYPTYEYGEVFEHYFENPEWKFIEKRNNGEYVVEFYGRFEYLGNPETATIRFSVYVDEEDTAYTQLEKILIDEEEVDEFIFAAILLEVFDKYQNYIDGITSSNEIESTALMSNEEKSSEKEKTKIETTAYTTEAAIVEETTSWTNNAVQDMDYGFIYGGIADMYYNKYSVYALHDMNNDGYLEFLMQTGDSAADTRYVVYTTDGNQAIQLGEIWGNVSLYAHESGNGVYTDYCQMGYEEVKYVYVENGSLVEEVVFAGQVEEYGYVDNKRMTELDISISTYEMTEGPMMGDNQPTDNVSSEFIFPESANRYLTEDEVRMLPKEMLKLGRNEIFARHGYIFKSEELQSYFESTSWYYGTVLSSDFDMEAVLNDYEKKNIELIKQIENE